MILVSIRNLAHDTIRHAQLASCGQNFSKTLAYLDGRGGRRLCDKDCHHWRRLCRKVQLTTLYVSNKTRIIFADIIYRTCLLTRYRTDEFPIQYIPTVFDNICLEKKFMINNQPLDIPLDLWDTAPHYQFDDPYFRQRLAYRDVDIFLICFNVMERSSFDNISSEWSVAADHYCPHAVKILVGTKCDLKDKLYDHTLLVYGYVNQLQFKQDLNIVDDVVNVILVYERGEDVVYDAHIASRYNDQGPVTDEDIDEIKEECKCLHYVETSALNGYNVNELFEIAVTAFLHPPGAVDGNSSCCLLL